MSDTHSTSPVRHPQPWRKLIAAGRAHEGLREGWRNQLRRVQREVGFEYIRFHGLFLDEMMVYHEGVDGSPIHNWRLVDDLFDFLLKVGLRPFVELSFMPPALASDDKTIFWWQGRISPPNDMKKWAELIREFCRHIVRRYGRDEVSQWYFEVWNEPNLKDWFFSGDQQDYFALYRATVEAIRDVIDDARVGGPSTSNFKDGEAPWVRDFLTWCRDESVPVDFVSTHPYPNTFPLMTDPDGVKTQLECYRDRDALRTDLTWLCDTAAELGFPDIEIHITEWSLSPNARDLLHDSSHAATFVVHNNLAARGLTTSLGWWVFSDIFEETRAGVGPYHGGFGLLTQYDVAKPAYHAYRFLAALGQTFVAEGPGWALYRTDSEYQLIAYNHCDYAADFAAGDRTKLTTLERYDVFAEREPLLIAVTIPSPGPALVTEERIGPSQDAAFLAWKSWGGPTDLTREQEQLLSRLSAVPITATHALNEAITVTATLAPHEVALFRIQPSRMGGIEA
jgi:xylan 1,4-beta-xylosidase